MAVTVASDFANQEGTDMSRVLYKVVLLSVVLSLSLAGPVFASAPAAPQGQPAPASQALPLLPASVEPAPARSPAIAPSDVVTFTILHINDFHGRLQPAGSDPGIARLAYQINAIRAAVPADTSALFDAGDIMQGTLLSNLFHGESTIDVYNLVGFDAATFGNHEFDWGQTVLISRTEEANFPFVSSNIVVNNTGNCNTAGWESPSWTRPWMTMTLGTAPNDITLGLFGVTSLETPFITIASATEGLCFRDPVESIQHYRNDVLAAGADMLIVLSHIGYEDGGYGYGLPVYGDKTLAARLNTAGTPVHMIIGGHSHTNVATPGTMIGSTLVVQANRQSRNLGRATVTFDTATQTVTGLTWQNIAISTSGAQDAAVQARVDLWANDPDYLARINQEVGYTAVNIVRNYYGDSLMGAFVNDAIYNDLNNDAYPENDVDMVFNNPGGLRADITGISGTTVITYGTLYNVLPFGNATVVGDMTGAAIWELLNQSAHQSNGAIQVSGIRYAYYRYTDTLPGPQPWAWGVVSATVRNRDTGDWEPLVLTRTYRIATNEFLAPAGQDTFLAFKYVTNLSYWGDMLDGVIRWVSSTYTISNPYSATLDGRISRIGTATSGPIIPVTILHHNDPHGYMQSGSFTSGGSTYYYGMARLSTLINQERAHNPSRTVLLNAGDTIQGDSMMYFYRTAPMGYSADGATLPVTMTIHPMMAVMNAMNYTAMVLGNHEFNFGNQVFNSVLYQANFPILAANLSDDGRYGLSLVPVAPYARVWLPGPSGQIKLAILGITNHRVPQYEMPDNIAGLTFSDPIVTAQTFGPWLASTNDAVVALTHIGFTTNPANVELDDRVDTTLAAQAVGIDAVIGGHSHTNPDVLKTDATSVAGRGTFKYLPSIIGGPGNTPVIVNQAYRYNTYLGEVVLGLLPRAGGGYDVVARAGRYIQVTSSTAEDPAITSIIAPYLSRLNVYNNTNVGQTTVPIDARTAYTQETNAANLQADASVWELAQHGIDVDFHLSGATTNAYVAATATPTTPVMLTIANMFTLVPYENSLVVFRMNGPQIKTILERAYRNYFYYRYVPGRGGYSYYTTCMLDINSVGQITYRDSYPRYPDGNNVLSLTINGVPVDFTDANTYYNVSTVNYLAAGSCNFNNGGVTIWPLDQIIYNTQYYVRDAVIHYIQNAGTVSPAIEGRLQFLGMPYFIALPFLTRP
jgi:2',3'-cyclic-nucleotide 2'-phosphodiesterase/3'-nucleotidase/5'-nucleotidase